MSNALIAFGLMIVVLIASIEVWRALRTGVTGFKSWPIADRTQRPVWFWFCTLSQVVIGMACLWLVIWWLTVN
jgi:hypothetical protein